MPMSRRELSIVMAAPRRQRSRRPWRDGGVPCSANGHRVHQPALGPQIVETALELERRILADIAVEDLAVIADQLDDVVGPFLVETDRLAHARRHAEDALDVGIVGLELLVDILRGDAVLLGLD